MARKAHEEHRTTRKLNCTSALRGFRHGRMPQRMLSLEYKSFTNNCFLLRFPTTEKHSKNHSSLMRASQEFRGTREQRKKLEGNMNPF